MKRNMGGFDKTIRLVLALLAGLLVYFEVVEGPISYILLTIMAVFVITSLVGFCPLYGIFGVHTCGKRHS